MVNSHRFRKIETRGGKNYYVTFIDDYCENEGIIHETNSVIHLNLIKEGYAPNLKYLKVWGVLLRSCYRNLKREK